MKRQPHSVTRQIERARTCVFRGNVEEAGVILDSLAKRHRRVPAVWVELSRFDRLHGRAEAVEHARRANELAPHDAQTLRELALALAEESDRMPEAVAAAERAVIADNTDAVNWATLASIRLADDDFDDAAAACHKALELDVFCVDAHLVLADTALATGDTEEAARCLRVALSLAPELEEIADALSWLEYRSPVNGDRGATLQAMTATLGGDSPEDGGPTTSPGMTPTGSENNDDHTVIADDHPPEPGPGPYPPAAPEADDRRTPGRHTTGGHPTDDPGTADPPEDASQVASADDSVQPHHGTDLATMSAAEIEPTAETVDVDEESDPSDLVVAPTSAPNDSHADHEPAVTTVEESGPLMRGPRIDGGPVPSVPGGSSEPSMTQGDAPPPVTDPESHGVRGPRQTNEGEAIVDGEASPQPTVSQQTSVVTSPDLEHMNQAVLDAVLRHIEAFNAKDPAALVDGFSEDAVLRTGPDRVVGHAQLRDVFGATFDEVDGLELELRSAVVQNGSAACELTELIDVDGDRYISEFVGIYTVHSGRIVRARIYRDAD